MPLVNTYLSIPLLANTVLSLHAQCCCANQRIHMWNTFGHVFTLDTVAVWHSKDACAEDPVRSVFSSTQLSFEAQPRDNDDNVSHSIPNVMCLQAAT